MYRDTCTKDSDWLKFKEIILMKGLLISAILVYIIWQSLYSGILE